MKIKISGCVLAAALCFTVIAGLTGCGIDEYIYLEPVSNILNNPTDTDVDSYKYFSFQTKDAENNADAAGYFKGWEIYYRIYNSVTDRSTDTAAIATKAADDPANAFNYVNTTKKYRRMTFIRGTDTSVMYPAPLIAESPSDRIVFIRPYTIGLSYPEAFTLNGVQVNLSGTDAFAWRSVTDVLAESFEYAQIDQTDADVQYNSSVGLSAQKWYLQAYVFAYGFDTSFKVIYSEPTSLGSITIEP